MIPDPATKMRASSSKVDVSADPTSFAEIATVEIVAIKTVTGAVNRGIPHPIVIAVAGVDSRNKIANAAEQENKSSFSSKGN